MIAKILDTAHSTVPHLQHLRDAGIETVIRYYCHRNSKKFPDKRLTRAEASAIEDHGMRIAVVFQQNGRDIANFSSAGGARDAQRALDCAGDIGQPEGSAIYFGVDEDFVKSAERAAIRDHFEAVRQIIAGRFRVGLYGSGGLAMMLLDAHSIDLVWLPRALGWHRSREFKESGRWNLFQNAIDTYVGSLSCDTNIHNAANGDFGSFSLSGTMTPTAPARPVFEVVARGGLHLRGGPGTNFQVFRTLPQGAFVEILERSADGEWAMVDLESDGLADGYCHAALLKPLGAG